MKDLGLDLDDDARKDWYSKQPVTNTHSKLLKKYGQKQEPVDNDELEKNEVIGDTLFRGQIAGGDPWKDGTYGGAFHYASPTKAGTRPYSGTPTGGAHQGDRYAPHLSSNKLRVIHHYKTNPGQRFGGSHAPEDIVSQPTIQDLRRERERLKRLAPGTPVSRHTETVVTKDKNPFVGTTLEGDYGDSYFFPTGKSALAAQNYAREMAKTVRSKEGNVEIGKPYNPNLTITPQNLSSAHHSSERLKKLEAKNPEKFAEFMRRRTNRHLFSPLD